MLSCFGYDEWGFEGRSFLGTASRGGSKPEGLLFKPFLENVMRGQRDTIPLQEKRGVNIRKCYKQGKVWF